MVYLTQRKSKIKGYVRYVHSNKKKWIPGKQIVQSIDLLLFFFPFLFQWVSIHSHSILKKKAQNPLFLQPNRSFDFGMNSSFHQYAVSYTHLYTSVSTL